jgi:hypothetical protein
MHIEIPDSVFPATDKITVENEGIIHGMLYIAVSNLDSMPCVVALDIESAHLLARSLVKHLREHAL